MTIVMVAWDGAKDKLFFAKKTVRLWRETDGQAVEKSFRRKDSEGRIVGKGTVRVPFP